jgi:hypothetical protein
LDVLGSPFYNKNYSLRVQQHNKGNDLLSYGFCSFHLYISSIFHLSQPAGDLASLNTREMKGADGIMTYFSMLNS